MSALFERFGVWIIAFVIVTLGVFWRHGTHNEKGGGNNRKDTES